MAFRANSFAAGGFLADSFHKMEQVAGTPGELQADAFAAYTFRGYGIHLSYDSSVAPPVVDVVSATVVRLRPSSISLRRLR